MFCIKRQMKKYLLIMFVAFSAMAYAQFQDNVFEKDKTVKSDVREGSGFTSNEGQSSVGNIPDPGDHEEGPGNPGPEIVPIDGNLSILLFSGLFLVFYFQWKNKKINI